MKSVALFSLSLVLLSQVLRASLILLNYKLNIDYIIENYCVNTDKPEMKCNGKCHLMKEIKADSEQKSEMPATLSETMILVLAVQEITQFDFSFPTQAIDPIHGLYLESEYSNHLQSIFHPPQV